LLPNAIIGGAQKAGTTSLFRYLSDHPDIFPSAVKEVDFFIDYADQIENPPLEKYHQYFSNCSDHKMIRIEASPRYLMKGEHIAADIKKYLPDVKLLFILRDPISLLLSYIKWKSNQTGRERSLDQILSAIDETFKHNFDSKTGMERSPVLIRLKAGCYAEFLTHFFEFFQKKNIGIFFYDDLVQDPKLLMKQICSFLEVDDKFYSDYTFHIENRSRRYKYANIHRLARKTNSQMERFLNRYPKIRRTMRDIYNRICEASVSQSALPKDAEMRLKKFYGPYNRELYFLLKQNYSGLDCPEWLQSR
jgi:hypothetical protein